MFEYLKGQLTYASPHKVVVDVSGVGYFLHISIATFQQLPQIGENVCLYTSYVVREDSQKLFGFLKVEDRDFFETLNEISGIGPRISISILGHMNVNDLHIAVEHGDTKSITKIPGIGKKMAERLILELKDKFTKNTLSKTPLTKPVKNLAMHDATGALITLGYKAVEAQKAVDQVLNEHKEPPPLPDLISLALKSRHL